MSFFRWKQIPFWLEIVLILFLGVIASAAVYIVGSSTRTATSESAQSSERWEDTIDPTRVHKVRFAYSDGTVIAEADVHEGKGVVPPPLETDAVFRGWSSQIGRVLSDKEVHPMFYSIVEENLFYFNSAYVLNGTDFSLPIILSGNVNISAGELTIRYDAQVLHYQDAACMDGCTVHMKEEGTLILSFETSDVLTEKTILGILDFNADGADVISTDVLLEANRGRIQTDDAEKPVVFSTINNKVYFLQEVEP